MAEGSHRTSRVVSVIAATAIALACGTNYVYSAWAPQFAAKLKLSSTESNLIGTAANLGMYGAGIPMGILVDTKGPRLPIMLGALFLGVGYFPMHTAYEHGIGWMSVPLLCFFSLLTGIGSCAAFSASLKTSALNWPQHRGTATAFPLAAFGLSAFFFSSIASFAFHDNTSDFLLLLSIGSFTMIFVSSFCLRVVSNDPLYSPLPPQGPSRPRSDSNQLHRPRSNETGKPLTSSRLSEPDIASSETSSLTSKSSHTASCPGDPPSPRNPYDHHHIDLRGCALLPTLSFWQLFANLGLLSGVGLMTINNIGNDAQALWSHYDDSVPPSFIQSRQLMHVSILSLASFAGRLLSGVGSDLIVKRLSRSRLWCLVAAGTIFTVAQVCAIRIENPRYLWSVSGLTGLGYGILYGVYPAMVSDAFGVHGFSQNWGCMTIAPIISGNIFNLLYGIIYDHHTHHTRTPGKPSSATPSGSSTSCTDGLPCYRASYYITLAASLLGISVSLWSIRTEHLRSPRRRTMSITSEIAA